MPTFTEIVAASQTQIAVATTAPSETPEPTITPSFTDEPTNTTSPSLTPSPTLTPSITPNFTATTQFFEQSTQTGEASLRDQIATQNANWTLAALSWTPTFTFTPTASYTMTPNIELTDRYIELLGTQTKVAVLAGHTSTQSSNLTVEELSRTPSRTATSEIFASQTNIPEPVVSPFLTATVEGIRATFIDSNQRINLRSRPSSSSLVISTALPNQELVILGRDQSGSWLYVDTEPTIIVCSGDRAWESCVEEVREMNFWVSASVVAFDSNVMMLPIIEYSS